MAVERAKVLAALDLKFKGKSITKNFKNSIAEKWAAKIETDEDIDAYIDDREDVILEAMRDKDGAVTAAVTKTKAELAASIKGEKTEDEQKEADVDPTMPAWAKALLDQNKALADKLSGFEQQQAHQTFAERLKSDERTKAIPAAFYKGRPLPTDAAGFETFAEELKGDYTEFATAHKLTALGSDSPAGGGAYGNAGTGKVDPDLAAFAQKKNEAFLQTQKN